MLRVEDPIVAARVLVALDTSELPEQLMAHHPTLSGRDVNAEAFRVLYKELAGDPRNDPPAPPTSQPDLSCTKCGARVQESSSFCPTCGARQTADLHVLDEALPKRSHEKLLCKMKFAASSHSMFSQKNVRGEGRS